MSSLIEARSTGSNPSTERPAFSTTSSSIVGDLPRLRRDQPSHGEGADSMVDEARRWPDGYVGTASARSSRHHCPSHVDETPCRLATATWLAPAATSRTNPTQNARPRSFCHSVEIAGPDVRGRTSLPEGYILALSELALLLPKLGDLACHRVHEVALCVGLALEVLRESSLERRIRSGRHHTEALERLLVVLATHRERGP